MESRELMGKDWRIGENSMLLEGTTWSIERTSTGRAEKP
jgi:hypothetical protein